MKYVNVYEVDRSYGGPEEGGWWYNTGTVVLTKQFDDEQQARAYADSLSEEYPNTGRSSSVIYSGGDYRIYVEDEVGQDYPDHRPHYE